MMVERLAMAKKIAAVPPNAVMIKLEPLRRPSTWAIRRDSIRPMKKVNPSRATTPVLLFLVRSITKTSGRRHRRRKGSCKPKPILARMPVRNPVDPGAEHRGHQGQGEQPIGIAQHALAVRSNRGAMANSLQRCRSSPWQPPERKLDASGF